MTRVYYKEAVGAFVVFDITHLETFEEVKKWKADIDSKVFIGNGNDRKNIPVVLLANKVDLDTSEEGFEHNNQAKLDKFCEEFGFVGWFAEFLFHFLPSPNLSSKFFSPIRDFHLIRTVPGTRPPQRKV